jgi:hypothetical protein
LAGTVVRAQGVHRLTASSGSERRPNCPIEMCTSS